MSALKTVVSHITDCSQDAQQRHDAALVIKDLYKSYGKTIKNDDFIKEIQAIDPIIGQLLGLLKAHQLVNNKSLVLLTKSTQKLLVTQQETTHVYISESNSTETLTGKISEHFQNVENSKFVDGTVGLHIHKNKAIYKRTLDKDIKQLLA